MTKTEVDNTRYDFSSERKSVMVLGCMNIVKKPTYLFYINIAYIFFAFSIYIYLMVMAVVTIVIAEGTKKVQVIRTLSAMTSVILLALLTVFAKKYLNLAANTVNKGIFEYSDDGIHDELVKIKSKRNQQIRFFVPFLTYMCFFNIAFNVFLLPLFKYLFINVEREVEYLNPYLPLPLYMPFSTDTIFGFGFAFILNGVLWFFLQFVYVAHIEATLSCNLQLCAQIEVFNYSIDNIKKRALYKYLKSGKAIMNYPKMDNQELQKFLYECLQENILHHHAILGFKSVIHNYVGGVNCIGILLYSIILASSVYVIIEDSHINVTLIIELASDSLGFGQLCLMGQIIANKSSATKDALYFIPWPECSKKFKVLLCIMITYAQYPVKLRTIIFNVDASMETFCNMVSAGYKIINVLR